MSDVVSSSPEAGTTPASSSPATSPAPSQASSGSSSPAQGAGNTAVPSVKALTPDAPPAQGGEAPAEKRARLLKLKVDGAEEEIDVDSLSDEKLARELQMARAAQKRMEEAANLKRQFTDIVEYIKRNPLQALQDPVFGIDVEKLVQERFAEKYKEATMPEGEREKYELQKRLKEYETRDTQRQQAEQQRQQLAMQQQVEAQLTKDFNEALTQHGLPNNRETMVLMAEIARMNLDHGIELTPAQMADQARERLEGINKHFLSSLKGDALLKHLGDEVVKEVLRTSVARVKGAQQAPPAPMSTKVAGIDEDKPARNMKSAAEFRKYLRT